MTRFFSFKSATIAVCFFNLAVAAALLLRGLFFGVAVPRRLAPSYHHHHLDPAQLKYVLESEALRRAMEPLELIRRIKEIEQEAYTESGAETQQAQKLTAAVDLSKRLKDLRVTNDANSQKALEEWRKRKIERARRRGIGKDATVSQT
uniref:Uncharacterized protein n=1 Tax=Ananas comosus var. bracteatus TaxID=296719 RepID=A0A6V7QCK1_ANACO|nr:unnamed protein product [Ananas comosus var. bracteatus]